MFVISKMLSAITQPMFWLALWWVAGLLLLRRWRRLALGVLWSGLVLLGALGFEAVPDALLRPLEARYPVPSAQKLQQQVGVIVLGGALGRPEPFVAHGQVPLGHAAERMTVPLVLMRQHPQWTLVFTGGEGRLLTTGVTEARMAKQFFSEQGLDVQRVQLESASRTTRENAREVAALLGERCRQPWLLVTSAWHMPRAMAEFEEVGCKVTAYPVDFATGTTTAWTDYSLAHSLLRWQTALHEWLGIWAYRLTR